MIYLNVVTITAVTLLVGLATTSEQTSSSSAHRPAGSEIHYPEQIYDPWDDASSKSVVLKLYDIAMVTAPDRKITECKNAETGYSSHPWRALCSQSFSSLKAQESFSATNPADLLRYMNEKRQELIDEGGRYIPRSEFVAGAIEMGKDGPEDTITWCNNPGTGIRSPSDSCSLCSWIDDNYIVPRGYIRDDGEHMCMCKKWGHNSEQMLACNCDLCDPWKIYSGLRNECKKLRDTCDGKGYLSGYSVVVPQNHFLRQYNDFKSIGKAHDYIIAQIQMDNTVCKSGVQGKSQADRDGGLFEVPYEEEDQCHKIRTVTTEDPDLQTQQVHPT